MTNIIVLCHERYRLTVQCVESIRRNTDAASYTLTLVDDGSQDFRVRNFLRDQVLYHPKNTTLLQVWNSLHCLGALKNLGVMHSELTFGRGGHWLCVLDNDVCVFDGWLDKLISVYDGTNFPPKSDGQGYDGFVLGGCRHPFHGVNKETSDVQMVDAVAGYCHFMDWSTWIDYGPYDSTATGIGQSEDFSLCQRVNEFGGSGYINPPVMTHCGITNSKGELIAGADLIERVPGVLYL